MARSIRPIAVAVVFATAFLPGCQDPNTPSSYQAVFEQVAPYHARPALGRQEPTEIANLLADWLTWPHFVSDIAERAELRDVARARQWLKQGDAKFGASPVPDPQPPQTILTITMPGGGPDARALTRAVADGITERMAESQQYRHRIVLRKLEEDLAAHNEKLAALRQAIQATLGDDTIDDVNRRYDQELAKLNAMKEELADMPPGSNLPRARQLHCEIADMGRPLIRLRAAQLRLEREAELAAIVVQMEHRRRQLVASPDTAPLRVISITSN